MENTLKRRVFRATWTEIEFRDLKKGDVFVLYDEQEPRIEDGTVVTVATRDASSGNGEVWSIDAEQGSLRLLKPIVEE